MDKGELEVSGRSRNAHHPSSFHGTNELRMGTGFFSYSGGAGFVSDKFIGWVTIWMGCVL